MITSGPHPWDFWERFYYNGIHIGNLETLENYSRGRCRIIFEDDRGFEKSWFDYTRDEVLDDLMKIVPYLGYYSVVYGAWHDYYKMIVSNKIPHHTVSLLPIFKEDPVNIVVSFIMDPTMASLVSRMEKWSKDLNKQYG